MQGQAAVFINLIQAARFGHVGWGFSLDQTGDRFYFGSTDHLYRHKWWDLPAWLRYGHVAPSGPNDWWCAIGTRQEMLHRMYHGSTERYHMRYHVFKEFTVDRADPAAAQTAAEFLEHNGWSLVTNNCVHQAYDVLTAYGATVPDPSCNPLHLMPKRWFDLLPGESVAFEDS